MATICIQMGHCFRTTGATGTPGIDADPTEQDFAVMAAARTADRLAAVGHVAVIIDADEPLASYGPFDGFVAIHCDGSVHPEAHGASVGYQNGQGQRFAQAFKDAYYAHGWRGFRSDNYTTALAGYYGVRNARAAGTLYAFIAECGFLTNPDDEAILQANGADMFAAALADAAVAIWGGPPPPPAPTSRSHDIMDLVDHPSSGRVDLVYVTNELGILHYWAANASELYGQGDSFGWEDLHGTGVAVSAVWATADPAVPEGEQEESFVVTVVGLDGRLYTKVWAKSFGWTSWRETPTQRLALV